MRAELSEQRLKMMHSEWEDELELFVQDLIDTEHGGDRAALKRDGRAAAKVLVVVVGSYSVGASAAADRDHGHTQW